MSVALAFMQAAAELGLTRLPLSPPFQGGREVSALSTPEVPAATPLPTQ